MDTKIAKMTEEAEAFILGQLADGPMNVRDLKAAFDREHFWFVVPRIRKVAFDLRIPWLGTFDCTEWHQSLAFTYALRNLSRSGRLSYKDRPMPFDKKVKAGLDPDDLRHIPELREYYLADDEGLILSALSHGEKTMGELIELFGLGGIAKPWWSTPNPNWYACFNGLLDRGAIKVRHEYPEPPKKDCCGEEKTVEERWLPPDDDDSFHVPPTRYFSLAEEEPKDGEVP